MREEVAVRVTDDPVYEGRTVFVLNTDTTVSGEDIPEEYVECIFQPMEEGGFVTELFHEDDLQLVC